jgi:hypothetical protein
MKGTLEDLNGIRQLDFSFGEPIGLGGCEGSVHDLFIKGENSRLVGKIFDEREGASKGYYFLKKLFEIGCKTVPYFGILRGKEEILLMTDLTSMGNVIAEQDYFTLYKKGALTIQTDLFKNYSLASWNGIHPGTNCDAHMIVTKSENEGAFLSDVAWSSEKMFNSQIRNSLKVNELGTDLEGAFFRMLCMRFLTESRFHNGNNIIPIQNALFANTTPELAAKYYLIYQDMFYLMNNLDIKISDFEEKVNRYVKDTLKKTGQDDSFSFRIPTESVVLTQKGTTTFNKKVQVSIAFRPEQVMNLTSIDYHNPYRQRINANQVEHVRNGSCILYRKGVTIPGRGISETEHGVYIGFKEDGIQISD